jgi:hypothetical protein
MTNEDTIASSPVSIALAWLVVALPAAWGVYNTILRAANLFTK